jgi:hypothetical protein
MRTLNTQVNSKNVFWWIRIAKPSLKQVVLNVLMAITSVLTSASPYLLTVSLQPNQEPALNAKPTITFSSMPAFQ